MADGYKCLYGNEAHTSFIPYAISTYNKIAWKKKLPYTDKKGTRIILSTGTFNVVGGFNQFHIFSDQGNHIVSKETKPLSPIVLYDMEAFFILPDRPNSVSSIKMDGTTGIKKAEIPYLDESTGIYLFQPVKNGMIMAIVDRPPIGDALLAIYLMHYDKLAFFDWLYTKSYPEIPIIPLICEKQRFLLSCTTLYKGQIFNLDGKPGTDLCILPANEFDLPFGQNPSWVSCNDKGDLFWATNDLNSVSHCVTDISGKQLGQIKPIPVGFPFEAEIIQPPIVTPSRTYILTKRNLFAIENNSLIWSYSTIDFSFSSGTACEDNFVLLIKENILVVINKDGKEVFKIDLKEQLNAPPVIDKNGRIFVASDNNLFCIQ